MLCQRFVCLFVTNFELNYLRASGTENGLKSILGVMKVSVQISMLDASQPLDLFNLSVIKHAAKT